MTSTPMFAPRAKSAALIGLPVLSACTVTEREAEPRTAPPSDRPSAWSAAGRSRPPLALAPGLHTLRLVLADADHRVIGPTLVSAPIRVVVRAR